jgi:flagellar hook assembly protein FlgD
VVETRLYAPQPNPFRTRLAIRYSLCATGRASVRVCDLAGRVVRTLVNSEQQPGRYSVTWNGHDDRGRELARGVYFCRFTAGDYRATEKLVLQR